MSRHQPAAALYQPAPPARTASTGTGLPDAVIADEVLLELPPGLHLDALLERPRPNRLSLGRSQPVAATTLVATRRRDHRGRDGLGVHRLGRRRCRAGCAVGGELGWVAGFEGLDDSARDPPALGQGDAVPSRPRPDLAIGVSGPLQGVV